MRWHIVVGAVSALTGCFALEPPPPEPLAAAGAPGLRASQPASSPASGGATPTAPASGGAPGISVSGTPTTGGVGGPTVTVPTSSVAPEAYSRECILERLASRSEAGAAGAAGSAQRARFAHARPHPHPKGHGGAAPDDGAGGTPGGGTDSVPPSGGQGGDGDDIELGKGDLTLVVVFDKSGSMGEPWDERTKWVVANEALMKAITKFADNLTVGTIFFPVPGECSVEPLGSLNQIDYMPGGPFVEYWQSSLETRSPNGSTPLALALRVADMSVEAGCRLGLLDERFRVVLVTDGEPTCGDDRNAMVSLVAEWYHLGVETWVMGLPGSVAATELLDAIALAGGTGQHQALDEPEQLDDGLEAAAE